MHTNNHQTRDYDAVLDEKYGAVGTREREQFEQEAWNFYSGQSPQKSQKEYGGARSATFTFAAHGKIEPTTNPTEEYEFNIYFPFLSQSIFSVKTVGLY